jgi:hypothetical protein
LGIHGGDDSGCGLGWLYLGLVTGYGITVVLSIAIFCLAAFCFRIFSVLPEARNNIVKIVMWIPLLGVLWFDTVVLRAIIPTPVEHAVQMGDTEGNYMYCESERGCGGLALPTKIK